MTPLFTLIDCNNFYVACERVFQSALSGKPVVVLSNNDGCVIARSKEAKALGITMGLPAFQLTHLLPGAPPIAVFPRTILSMVICQALGGIEQIFCESYHYKKAGVILTELVPAYQVQTGLFDQYDRECSQRLVAALDVINTPWGTGTVRYGAVGVPPRWIMRCARRSHRDIPRGGRSWAWCGVSADA